MFVTYEQFVSSSLKASVCYVVHYYCKLYRVVHAFKLLFVCLFIAVFCLKHEINLFKVSKHYFLLMIRMKIMIY